MLYHRYNIPLKSKAVVLPSHIPVCVCVVFMGYLCLHAFVCVRAREREPGTRKKRRKMTRFVVFVCSRVWICACIYVHVYRYAVGYG